MTERVNIPTYALGGAVIPQHALNGDAGVDLTSIKDVKLDPMERTLVSTGLMAAIPNGYVGMVCPRSGLAIERGITVLNAPGIVDSGYRGEIKVILANLSEDHVELRAGTRVAQLVVVPYARQRWTPVDSQEALSGSERGERGFGSTGQ